MKEERRSYTQALKKALLGLAAMMPMVVGVVGLVGVFEVFITQKMLASLFTGDAVKDTVVGTLAGGVAVGNALVSYILGGELLEQGMSLYAVTAFILAWVTLGVVQLPLEAQMLGVRFTVTRNLLALLFTMLVAIATVWTLGLVK
ncbi:permease [Hydrogenimonas sp.]